MIILKIMNENPQSILVHFGGADAACVRNVYQNLVRRAADGLSFPATLEGVAVLESKYIPNIVSFFF